MPLPVPDAPDITTIQLTLLTAVHVHVLLDGVTVAVLLPPAVATLWLVGVTV
ncbi:hypothetical protein MBAV_004512 [Candidatus Magnetobacterium bavaricum]|uniref:Uncharacterized protein n=1 Tax=Candidatus Magnetobacterium bavaricum TaxID=29290 RepID=A0A0F3GKN8_9BACT|nr:hypothetical protein MBAV_005414 [Candidatus Magnetobacterium bavaricum]KJU83291.1 hypothetical protein MBAV_004512 [Candidatus Magnetobacterium bavaricum]